MRLQLAERRRELALFNLAIDSKLRACDLVKLRVRDVCHGQVVAARAIVLQQKTQRPVGTPTFKKLMLDRLAVLRIRPSWARELASAPTRTSVTEDLRCLVQASCLGCAR